MQLMLMQFSIVQFVQFSGEIELCYQLVPMLCVKVLACVAISVKIFVFIFL